MSVLASFLSFTAALAGLTAGIYSWVTTAADRRRRRETIHELRKKQEEEALASVDLRALGDYLYTNLGNVTVTAYAQNPEISAKVRRALDSVANFLGPDVLPAPTKQDSSPEQVAEIIVKDINDEMDKARTDILYGEVWNGLARMRRAIENELRTLTPIAVGSRKNRSIPVGALIETLRSRRIIDDTTANHFRYAVQVANAAVHGEEVSVGQADEAWRSALLGLVATEHGIEKSD